MDLENGSMLFSYEKELRREADVYHRRQELLTGQEPPRPNADSVFDNPAATEALSHMNEEDRKRYQEYGEYIYSNDFKNSHLNLLIEHVHRIEHSLEVGLDRQDLRPQEIRALIFLYGEDQWKHEVFGDLIDKATARRLQKKKHRRKPIDASDPKIMYEIEDILAGLGVPRPTDESNVVIENDWTKDLPERIKKKHPKRRGK